MQVKRSRSPPPEPGGNPRRSQFSSKSVGEAAKHGCKPLTRHPDPRRQSPQPNTRGLPVRPHPPPGRPQDLPLAVADSTTVPAAGPGAAFPPSSPGLCSRCARERASRAPLERSIPGQKLSLRHSSTTQPGTARSPALSSRPATSGRRAREGAGPAYHYGRC